MQVNTSSQVTATFSGPSSLFLNVPTPEVMPICSLSFKSGHILSPVCKTAPVGALPSSPILSSFSQHNHSSPNISSPSTRCLHPISYIVFLLFILPHVLLASASAAFAFHSIAINANGLSDPMKIAALASMTRSAKPHVLIIGETKSVHHVPSHLTISDYDFYENPGQPVAGTHNCGKWGVIVGVRQGLLMFSQFKFILLLMVVLLHLILSSPLLKAVVSLIVLLESILHGIQVLTKIITFGILFLPFVPHLIFLGQSMVTSMPLYLLWNLPLLLYRLIIATRLILISYRKQMGLIFGNLNLIFLFTTLSHIKLTNLDLNSKPLFLSKVPLIVLPHCSMASFLDIFMS